MDGEPLVSQFVDDLTAVVTKYQDQGLTVAEAIGGLEMVKFSTFHNRIHEDDGDED